MKALSSSVVFTAVILLGNVVWGEGIECGKLDDKADQKECYRKYNEYLESLANEKRNAEVARKKAACDTKIKDLLDLRNKVLDACSESSMQSEERDPKDARSKCFENAQECSEKMKSATRVIQPGMGLETAVSDQLACPMSAESAEKINKEIKDIQKDLNDANKDHLKAQKDQQKAWDEWQKDSAMNEKTRAENAKKNKKAMNQLVSAKNKALSELARANRTAQANLGKLRTQKNSVLSKQAQVLAANTKKYILSDCRDKNKAEYDKAAALIKNGADGRELKTQFFQKLNRCIDERTKAKQDLVVQQEGEISRLNDDINNAVAEVNQTNKDIADFNADYQKEMASTGQDMSDDERQYAAEFNRLQNRLVTMQESNKKEDNSHAMRIQQLELNLAKAKNKMAITGDQDEQGSKKTFKDVMAAEMKYSDAESSFDDECCEFKQASSIPKCVAAKQPPIDKSKQEPEVKGKK